jgi:exopolyphosphatase/guanosine-5'-triphosphate,3'-diphosphate pyrophosphatase
MRIAAIDIGTNSIHMVVAEATRGASFEVIEREREVVQVGRGSFTGTRLRSDAIRRTVEALARFVQLARRLQVDRILCTATAAVRESKNGGEFVTAARKACGISPRVIPAEEEGRLIYLAVRRALQLDDRPALIVDIGGGSMQLVVGNRERLLLATGAPLGALRLTERILANDPPSRRELQALRREVRKRAKSALERVSALGPTTVYGSSGSIQALAQAAHWEEEGAAIEHLNGHMLSLESLQRLTRRLTRMSEAERHALRGLDAKRAEIIVPGAVVLQHVLEETGAGGIVISDFGVREGLVSDYLEFHAAEITALDEVEDLRLRSVLGLLQKFQMDGAHPRHVAELSLQLFDGLAAEHSLPPGARDLLRFAALLHDIGSSIGFDGHAEHSRYVILNGKLRGLSGEDLAVVANVARYHGGARPRKRDDHIRALSKPQRRTVRWLAAMLRIAEGLDRSHYQLVRSVEVRRRRPGWVLRITARRDAQLELWAVRQRTQLLERVLGGPVRIAMRSAAAVKKAGVARRRRPRKPTANGPSLAVVPVRLSPRAASGLRLAPSGPLIAPAVPAGPGGRASRRRREPRPGNAGERARH